MNKNIIVAAGGLVFNKENKLLMIYRRGFWDLPKGKLDTGEAIEKCALREVQEETGLKNILLKELIGITYHDYFDKWTNANVTKETHWYKMLLQTDETLFLQHEEDIVKAEWVNPLHASTLLKNSYANIVEIVIKSGFVEKV